MTHVRVISWKDSAASFADCLIEARDLRLGCTAGGSWIGDAISANFRPHRARPD
jgi:hypothetical protein